ncbi:MAG TPA: XdhC family protein [Vicinamibacterales bacterium]|nr:XdhC family protein [Vicinamibacterales bacterium]
MTMRDWYDKVLALRREGRSFATATVVGRRAPVSAHLGDRAIVYADGRMEGFIGGACSREIVRKQALDAIRTRRARLVSIRPDAASAAATDPEHVVVAMTCVSEGAVEVYVEPDLRPRRIVVVGATPVADALARTAVTLDYDVVRVVDAHEVRDLEAQAAALGYTIAPLESLDASLKEGGPTTVAVVASQGHYDEQALETILRRGAAYVGLLASRTRGSAVKGWLSERGAPAVDSVRNPAGLDLGARTAPEVALSILAEIVQCRPDQAAESEPAAQASGEIPRAAAVAVSAIDPVCHMDVDVATARHTAEINGTRYYFCCAQCQSTFVKDPDRYLTAAHD